ncbi:hypothetical protein ACLOJK_020165 [Asimina triloba]
MKRPNQRRVPRSSFPTYGWLRLHPYLGRGRKLLCRVRSGDGVLAVSARLGTRWIFGSDGSCLAVCVHVMAWMGRWGRCGSCCLEITPADGPCRGGSGRWPTSLPADDEMRLDEMKPVDLLVRCVSSQLGCCHGNSLQVGAMGVDFGLPQVGAIVGGCGRLGGACDRSVAHLAIDLSLIAAMLFPNSQFGHLLVGDGICSVKRRKRCPLSAQIWKKMSSAACGGLISPWPIEWCSCDARSDRRRRSGVMPAVDELPSAVDGMGRRRLDLACRRQWTIPISRSEPRWRWIERQFFGEGGAPDVGAPAVHR